MALKWKNRLVLNENPRSKVEESTLVNRYQVIPCWPKYRIPLSPKKQLVCDSFHFLCFAVHTILLVILVMKFTIRSKHRKIFWKKSFPKENSINLLNFFHNCKKFIYLLLEIYLKFFKSNLFFFQKFSMALCKN